MIFKILILNFINIDKRLPNNVLSQKAKSIAVLPS